MCLPPTAGNPIALCFGPKGLKGYHRPRSENETALGP